MTASPWPQDPADLAILRDLARQYRDLAQQPDMAARRQLWTDHNDLRPVRPLILVESLTGGLCAEIFAGQALRCRAEWARQLEHHFRRQIYHYTVVKDDDVPNPVFTLNWKLDQGNYGVELKREHGVDAQGGKLGFHWDPPIKDLERDFGLLKERRFAVDREGTLAWKKHLEEVFGDILPVQIRSRFWWTMGLTQTAIYLVGLEKFMLYMCDQPEALHALMAFLRDDHLRLIEYCEREGLLALNNAHDYNGSGSRGFTSQLPQADWREGQPVRPRDQWVLSESQETVGISPRMFAEFILPYQKAITKRFGLVYYGCCEPVDNRWQHLATIPNLRAVSISPWAKVEFMAEAMGSRYVYSRKPAPALLSTPQFNEEAIRADLRQTIRAAQQHGCPLELIMKDLHTTSGHPERMARWVQLCREEIAAVGW